MKTNTNSIFALLLLLLVAVGGAKATTYTNTSDAGGLCSSSQNTYYPSGGTQACQDLTTLTITTTQSNEPVTIDARTWLRKVSGGTYNGIWRVYDKTSAAIVGAEQTTTNPTSPGLNQTYSVNITVVTPGTYNYTLQYHTSGLFSALAADGYTLTVTTHPSPPPTADFSANATSGFIPLSVQFSDLSTDSPTSWAWDFDGDSVIDSTSQNPTYSYAAAGTYTVSLTATNAFGNDTETKVAYINPSVDVSVHAPSLGGGGRQVTAKAVTPTTVVTTTTETTSTTSSSTTTSEPTLFSKIANWFKGLFK